MIKKMELTVTLALGKSERTFDLAKAVCNHGSFMMAPNRWNPTTMTLQRPLRLGHDSSASADVSISHSSRYPERIYVRITSPFPLSRSDVDSILGQVSRMLRISESDEKDIEHFHSLHPWAKEKGFGRLFRSPSLFEDAVKSILLCNANWGRSLQMAEALCKFQFEIESSKGQVTWASANFPTPKQILGFGESEFLKRMRPSLGYRAKYVLGLAKDVESGRLRVEEIETSSDCERVQKMVMNIKGLGSFATANLLMCLGFYHNIPSDSETIRHLKQIHKLESCDAKTFQKHLDELYHKYAPFQCLAYWMELLEYYENKFGKLSQLPESCYPSISGSNVN